MADANTLYAVDSELGELVWQKTSPPPRTGHAATFRLSPRRRQSFISGAPAGRCQTGRTRPSATPSEEPLPRAERRVGAAAGGGYFGLRGVYVVTSDGYIHEQIMATGLDYAPPVKFLPAPDGSSFGLNMNDKVVYTATGSGCRNVANAIWSIDLNTPDYTVNSYKTQKISLAGLSGPAIGQRRHRLCRHRQRAGGCPRICQ